MKKIDAVKMVRKIRDEQYKLTKSKSKKALIKYFHQEAKLINTRLKKRQIA